VGVIDRQRDRERDERERERGEKKAKFEKELLKLIHYAKWHFRDAISSKIL
jgi:hypothetical protein